MTTIDSYNLKGQKTGTLKLPAALAAKPNSQLLAQATYIALSNQRRGLAKAQTRGESGRTTAKIYRQKHTGRARHGSRSAPIYVGGGVAHGPTGQENFRKSFPKRMSRLALAQAFSLKVGQRSLLAVTNLEKIEPKAKAGQSLLTALKISGGKIIVVPVRSAANITRAFGNLPGVAVLPLANLSSYDVLGARMIVAAGDALTAFGQPPRRQAKKN